jgi:hypothetical protein
MERATYMFQKTRRQRWSGTENLIEHVGYDGKNIILSVDAHFLESFAKRKCPIRSLAMSDTQQRGWGATNLPQNRNHSNRLRVPGVIGKKAFKVHGSLPDIASQSIRSVVSWVSSGRKKRFPSRL